ncbi:MAG: hypothetical protein LBU13_09045 [Synergistaceae bacterium]|jgi:hypothetical protein|nr:hypothetical protein [Synergistaceae bacterium]
MTAKFAENVMRMLEDERTVKVLTTVDSSGTPHSVVKNSLRSDEEGNIVCLELIESSRTNSNMTGSLWFGRKVSILLVGRDGSSLQIKGRPYKCVVAGPVFEAHYRETRKQLGNVDLGAVWIIAPDEIIDESFETRWREESDAHPLRKHLDRIRAE